jgi:hypothetical protein
MQAMGHLAPAAGAFAKSTVDAKVLNEGVGQSFGILTFRGKVWRIKFRGVETPLLMPPRVPGGPQDTPQPNIDVVIVHASPAISKIWYNGGYQEGDKEAPDCFSVNGVSPDPASPDRQAELCATCPKNVWGSKTTEAGKPGKACQDSKRLVVVPAGDLQNEMFGGPMLLRVPPASLQDMGQYNDMLGQMGHRFYTVRTQLGFDHQVAYPKLTWAPIASLSDSEAQVVVALQEDPRTKRILSEAVDQVRHEAPAQIEQQPAPQPTPQPAPAQPAPAVYTPPVQPAQPAPAPQYVDAGPIPIGLVRTASSPVTSAAAPTPAPVQAAPEPAPFRVLSPEEMVKLPPDQLPAYLAALTAHYAAQVPAATPVSATASVPASALTPASIAAATAATPVSGRGRGRRAAAPAAATPVPPPSPAPTPDLPVGAPAGNPFGGGGAPLTAPPEPTSSPAAAPDAENDAALNDLNSKLGALLG